MENQSNISFIISILHRLLRDFLAILPNLVIAAIIFVVFIFIARNLRKAVIRFTANRKSAYLGIALGRISQWILLLIGVLVCTAIAFPSVRPVDVISILGISGVAIGFAFKDIFQNFLAGILILIRQPFRIGDQVVFKGYEGTVEQIETRATIIKTYDGRLAHIPNGEIFISSILINTAYNIRRSESIIPVDLEADLNKAASVILEAIKSIKGVLADPMPDIIINRITDSFVNITARWWTGALIADVLNVQHGVLTAIHTKLKEAEIPLPTPTSVVYLRKEE